MSPSELSTWMNEHGVFDPDDRREMMHVVLRMDDHWRYRKDPHG